MTRISPVILLVGGLAVAIPALARSQQGAPTCDREATTAIQFGHAGGNLVPETYEITRTGSVRHQDDEHHATVLGHVPRDSVRALARRAWRGGFAALPPAPTHPTANPDIARPYIELHTACGLKHVEYAPGTESPLFRELYARLKRLTAPMRRTRP